MASTLTGAEYLLEYSTDNGASWQPVFSRTGETIEAGGCTSSVLNNGRLTVNSVGTATFSASKQTVLLCIDSQRQEHLTAALCWQSRCIPAHFL